MKHIDVVAVTHRGRQRRRNEDTISVAGFQSGVVEGQPIRFSAPATRPMTCLVADGLGGHPEGGRASRLVAATIADAAPSFHDAAAVRQAVQAANEAVYGEMTVHRDWNAMGSTVVLLVLTGEKLICANVGDSRCFLRRDDILVQLSSDDSVAPGPGETTVATVVTQTLGGLPERTAVEPHILEREFEPGDQFLLCSDGLTDELTAERIEAELSKAGDPLTAVEELLRAALDAGARDNVSIVLVTVPGDESPGDEPPADEPQADDDVPGDQHQAPAESAATPTEGISR